MIIIKVILQYIYQYVRASKLYYHPVSFRIQPVRMTARRMISGMAGA